MRRGCLLHFQPARCTPCNVFAWSVIVPHEVESSRVLPPPPLPRRFVDWTLRHGRLLWAVALLVAVPASLRAASLYRNLRSDIEELLPRDAPSVRAIQELREHMAGLQYLGVVVEAQPGSDILAGQRLLDDLAARVRQYPPSLVTGVRVGFEAERDFVERHAAILLAFDDLPPMSRSCGRSRRVTTCARHTARCLASRPIRTPALTPVADCTMVQ